MTVNMSLTIRCLAYFRSILKKKIRRNFFRKIHPLKCIKCRKFWFPEERKRSRNSFSKTLPSIFFKKSLSKKWRFSLWAGTRTLVPVDAGPSAAAVIARYWLHVGELSGSAGVAAVCVKDRFLPISFTPTLKTLAIPLRSRGNRVAGRGEATCHLRHEDVSLPISSKPSVVWCLIPEEGHGAEVYKIRVVLQPT